MKKFIKKKAPEKIPGAYPIHRIHELHNPAGRAEEAAGPV